jgi:hypothetical protein
MQAFDLLKRYGSSLDITIAAKEDLLYRNPEDLRERFERSGVIVRKDEAARYIELLRSKYVICNADEGLPVREEYDMVIFGSGVNEYLRRKIPALKEALRVCKDGGIVYDDLRQAMVVCGNRPAFMHEYFAALGFSYITPFNDYGIRFVKDQGFRLPGFEEIANQNHDIYGVDQEITLYVVTSSEDQLYTDDDGRLVREYADTQEVTDARPGNNIPEIVANKRFEISLNMHKITQEQFETVESLWRKLEDDLGITGSIRKNGKRGDYPLIRVECYEKECVTDKNNGYTSSQPRRIGFSSVSVDMLDKEEQLLRMMIMALLISMAPTKDYLESNDDEYLGTYLPLLQLANDQYRELTGKERGLIDIENYNPETIDSIRDIILENLRTIEPKEMFDIRRAVEVLKAV